MDGTKATLTYNNPVPVLRRLFWRAVLSSAFLAAAITLAGTWLIENHKTNLILQQARIQNAEKNYESLASLLDDLSSQMGDLTATASLALKSRKESPQGKQLHDTTLASLGEVAGSMTNVLRASERHGIDPQITKDVKDVLDPLVPEMERAQSNFENVRSICKLYEESVKAKLGFLQIEIQKKISDMTV